MKYKDILKVSFKSGERCGWVLKEGIDKFFESIVG